MPCRPMPLLAYFGFWQLGRTPCLPVSRAGFGVPVAIGNIIDGFSRHALLRQKRSSERERERGREGGRESGMSHKMLNPMTCY